MDLIYIFLLFAIGIILAIGVGLEISKGIDEFIIYVLFWFLYIITLITFINIILVINYYMKMKNKQGPIGIAGVQGEQGDKGETGKCDSNCRDSICENAINELLLDELRTRQNGVRVDVNNIYIKSKIHQMCSSSEFKQLAPYNGPVNLINYMKDIWKIWIDLLYDAGGMLYFQSIGAEDQFDWLKSNPFDEMKKYDIFYWGMGKQYRPQIIDKCYTSNDGNTISNLDASGSIIQVAKTDLYDFITNDDNIQSFTHASFWRPKQFTYKTAIYYPLGDIVMGPVRKGENVKGKKHIGGIIFPYKSSGPARETILVSGDVKSPINYELLWTNSGWNTTSNKTTNYIWIWRPIAPVNYIALGDVITTTADPPQTGDGAPIRCVPFDMVIRLPANHNVLWSSNGSPVDVNINLLGFKPNNGEYQSADGAINAYNLFRGVVGWETVIPESDINGNFYYLDTNKYNSSYVLGVDNGRPDTSNEGNRVGKGIISTPQRDSKYSVIAYLNLKNSPKLQHQSSKIELQGEIIPNAISNSYIIKFGNKCLSYLDNSIKLVQCDELIEDQYFSILFTGNMKNQCRLKHFKTGLILKYDNKLFNLVDDNSHDEMTLFLMI